MRFDFTTILDRRGKDSVAADMVPFADVVPDAGVETIPMWVADMSFPVAPCVTRAIEKRMEMPNYGYFPLPDAYYDAIKSWQSVRNGVSGLEKEHIGYENGVLGGVSSALRALTEVGDRVLLHSPTYIGFTHVLDDIGRTAVHSPLVRDKDGIWRMDYADMEAKLRTGDIRIAILCSPHNPCGRAWERSELERAMELFEKYDVTVISDEIWSDILLSGHRHIPTQTVSDDAKNRTVALYAPSKTFSLAGLIGSYHIIYDEELRERVRKVSDETHYNSCNVLSLHALLGAFTDEGMAWADEMCAVIDGNMRYACDFIRENFPGVTFMRPEATYILFLDCTEWLNSHGITIKELLHRGVRAGVIWQDGEAFLLKNAIRMNLALPFARLKEAFDRLKMSVFVD